MWEVRYMSHAIMIDTSGECTTFRAISQHCWLYSPILRPNLFQEFAICTRILLHHNDWNGYDIQGLGYVFYRFMSVNFTFYVYLFTYRYGISTRAIVLGTRLVTFVRDMKRFTCLASVDLPVLVS